MKTKQIILLALGLLAAFVVGLIAGSREAEEPPGSVTETIEIAYDTVTHYEPNPQEELAMGTRQYTIPNKDLHAGTSGGVPRCTENVKFADTTVVSNIYNETICDSTIVELSMVQRHYADSTYEAWVSGPLDPRLDSVKVFQKNTLITQKTREPPKRWHIGITAGYGFGTRGFESYIGVGITYSIFSF